MDGPLYKCYHCGSMSYVETDSCGNCDAHIEFAKGMRWGADNRIEHLSKILMLRNREIRKLMGRAKYARKIR